MYINIRNHNGQHVRTTSNHTDATWLTTIRSDHVGSLYVRRILDGKMMKADCSVTGAPLVNTGNVLGRASEDCYKKCTSRNKLQKTIMYFLNVS
jgi:isopenicillin N synthase-like dioxygenase